MIKTVLEEMNLIKYMYNLEYRDLATNALWDDLEVESIKYGSILGECRVSSRVDKDSLSEDELEEGNHNFDVIGSIIEYDLFTN